MSSGYVRSSGSDVNSSHRTQGHSLAHHGLSHQGLHHRAQSQSKVQAESEAVNARQVALLMALLFASFVLASSILQRFLL